MYPVVARLALVAGFLVAAACSRGDDTLQKRGLDDTAAVGFVGAWHATFHLDRSLRVSADSLRPPPISGTFAFVQDRYGRVGVSEIGGVTHHGVYDIDFRPFGFEIRDRGSVPVAVARVSPVTDAVSGDSLVILLDPGAVQPALRMTGAFRGDSVAGEWRAESSAGGSQGRFSLRRLRGTAGPP